MTTGIKGLDMKRQEYCVSLKQVSQWVFLGCARRADILEQIFSGEPKEIVVENIHEYLTKIGRDIGNGSI